MDTRYPFLASTVCSLFGFRNVTVTLETYVSADNKVKVGKVWRLNVAGYLQVLLAGTNESARFAKFLIANQLPGEIEKCQQKQLV